MERLIRYCCDKGLHNFLDFKFERKSRIVMREHFVSNKDVEKYDLSPFVQMDKFGRYKLPKYFLRKFSNLMTDILSGFLCVRRRPGIVGVRGDRRIQTTFEDLPNLLLNPNDEILSIFESIQREWDKDLIKTRAIKIYNIKRKLNKLT